MSPEVVTCIVSYSWVIFWQSGSLAKVAENGRFCMTYWPRSFFYILVSLHVRLRTFAASGIRKSAIETPLTTGLEVNDQLSIVKLCAIALTFVQYETPVSVLLYYTFSDKLNDMEQIYVKFHALIPGIVGMRALFLSAQTTTHWNDIVFRALVLQILINCRVLCHLSANRMLSFSPRSQAKRYVVSFVSTLFKSGFFYITTFLLV